MSRQAGGGADGGADGGVDRGVDRGTDGDAGGNAGGNAPGGEAPVVELRGACVHIGSDRILHGVDLAVRRGEVVGIAGPNGGGKTTLLRAILGLLPTRGGSVRLFGVPQRAFRARHRIGYVPQNAAHIDPAFPATALEVVLLGRVAPRGLLRRLRRADREMAQEALGEVGLLDLRDRRIGAMSGGQRQRVLLARALAGQPDLLVLDEPTTGIDPQTRDEFLSLLRHLNAEHAMTILLVSHDLDTLSHVADRLVVVDRTIVHDAPVTPDALLPAHLHVHGPRAGRS